MMRALLLCLTFLWPLAAWAQPAFQVKDINTTLPLALPFTGEFAAAGGLAFFAVSDGLRGSELWRSDGTAAGTFLLGDLCPGICSSSPRSLTALGSRVFFIAEDGLGRSALWSSDGTVAGTSLFLADAPLQMTAAAGSLFLVRSTAAAGSEIWRSDGTAAGTVLLEDIWPGPGGSSPVLLGEAGGSLFFTAEAPSLGRELWKTTGSEAGTALVKDVRPGTGSFPVGEAAVSGETIFLATTDAELWVSDGSEPGTVLVKSGLETPFDLIPSSGGIVFSTLGQPFGSSILWASDGTGAGTVQLLSSGCGFTCSPPWDDLVSSNGQVFFSNVDEHGIELWKTDGTPAGTVLVKDIHPTSGSLDFRGASLTAFADGVLFFADDDTHGAEVWKSDGTEAGTALVADLEPGAGSSIGGTDTQIPHPDRPLHGVVTAGHWLFLARTSAAGWSLWKTDGTQGGTALVVSIDRQTPALSPETAGYPKNRSLAGLSDVLVFHASNGTVKNGLWRSDGSPDGTSLVAGLPYSPPRSFTVAGNNVYFIWEVDFFAWRLFYDDGTQLNSLNHPFHPTQPAQLTPLGASLFFSALHSPPFFPPPSPPPGNYLFRKNETALEIFAYPNPTQLTLFGNRLVFKSNGTYWFTDETSLAVSPLDPPDGGSGGISSRDLLAAAGDNLFLLVNDSTFGRELWKIDITGASSLVKDIRPGSASSFDPLHPYVPGDFAAAGGRLLFVADDGVSGRELWVSDGTAAGTFRLADILPGAASSEPAWLTAAGKLVYFVADDGVHGRELWVSDGTSAGTRLVEDIRPGAGSSWPQHLAWRRHTLLFAADDGVHGFEPWVSDGTEATTFLLQDIAPGALPSSPLEFTETGTFLYFAATDGTLGRELWALPKSVVGSRFDDATRAHWAWTFIEALAASGFTGGCGGESYCPDDAVTRAQMAVFLLRGTRGTGFVPPPATGAVFTDVSAGYWAAPWIEQLAAEGITGGCAPGVYCPDNPVTRAEMAVFLTKTFGLALP
jgi:ELWxxDGT repeat protein